MRKQAGRRSRYASLETAKAVKATLQMKIEVYYKIDGYNDAYDLMLNLSVSDVLAYARKQKLGLTPVKWSRGLVVRIPEGAAIVDRKPEIEDLKAENE